METTSTKQQKHFVLVHGACHGAWCWYKLKPLLESDGHRVTTLDLAASGINSKRMFLDVRTIFEYTEPLLDFMASIPDNEKVILVGHSLGGINLAIVMDKFPGKVLAAIFLTAFMPDIYHKPLYFVDQYFKSVGKEFWMDTQFVPCSDSKQTLTTMLFGPNMLTHKLYQLCPIQDLELAKSLVRPSSVFLEDLSEAKNFSSDGYGSVKRVYIVCKDDLSILEEFQRLMIKASDVKDVLELDADHMPMLSKPDELHFCLLQIADACQ